MRYLLEEMRVIPLTMQMQKKKKAKNECSQMTT